MKENVIFKPLEWFLKWQRYIWELSYFWVSAAVYPYAKVDLAERPIHKYCVWRLQQAFVFARDNVKCATFFFFTPRSLSLNSLVSQTKWIMANKQKYPWLLESWEAGDHSVWSRKVSLLWSVWTPSCVLPSYEVAWRWKMPINNLTLALHDFTSCGLWASRQATACF